MMLDLRLVERVNAEESVQSIDKFPATIGKSKNSPLPPPYHMHTRIDNAALSNFHCSIEHSISLNTWTVTDGNPEKTSTNGIWFKPKTATEMERVSSCVMQNNGDRVYLLSTKDNREVFLEVFNPILDPIDPSQSTKSLDPALVEIKATAIDAQDMAVEAKAMAQKNLVAIGEIDANIDQRVRQALTVLKILGMDWRIFTIGTLVFGFIGLVGIGLTVFHSNRTNIYDDFIKYKNEKKSNEFDRTLPPRM